MSDKYTEVVAGGRGLGLWGHVPPAEAVEQTRAFWENELLAIQRALGALDADEIRVWHQLGPYAAKGRKLVYGKAAT
jgi:hypothetical protein